MGTAGAPDTARSAEASGWPGAADGPELAFAGLAEQAALLRSREISARELVELSLERIEASQPRRNAFRVICAEAALMAADQAERSATGRRGSQPPRALSRTRRVGSSTTRSGGASWPPIRRSSRAAA
jgi:amidase